MANYGLGRGTGNHVVLAKRLVVLALTVLFSSFLTTEGFAAKRQLRDFLPRANLPKYVADHLYVPSLTLGVLALRKRPSQVHISDLGLKLIGENADTIGFEEPDKWDLTIQVLGTGDYNGDGIRDVLVCVSENAAPAGGTYYGIHAYVLTKLSANSPLLAIAYRQRDKRCEDVEH